MILIPDKSVLLVLKEGNIPIEDIRLRIMTNEDYTHYEVSFDGESFLLFRKGMKIPQQYHSKRFLQFKLRCRNKANEVLEFVAERMPLQVYTFVGERVEDLYPVAIQKVLDLQETINKKINSLQAEIDELKSLGELGEL